MASKEYHEEIRNKIIEGLKLAFQNMVKFKKEKNSIIVVMQDGRIVKLKP